MERKLTDEQHEHIKVLYNKGMGVSIRQLSIMYGVQRNAIRYIVNPETRVRANKLARERRKAAREVAREAARQLKKES